MFVWLLYDKPWTLPAGGAVVGYITNWLAIKLIFEPVDPVKLGPFVLQGLFLKRQDEVRCAAFHGVEYCAVVRSPRSLVLLWLFGVYCCFSVFCLSFVASSIVPGIVPAGAVQECSVGLVVVGGGESIS